MTNEIKKTINDLVNTAKSQKLFEQLVKKDDLNDDDILMFLIEKYYLQRKGTTQDSRNFAENEEELADNILWDQWFNDGQPTGIDDDKMCNALQLQVFGEVIYK